MKTEKKPIQKIQKPKEKGFVQSQSTLIPSSKSKKSLTILNTSQILNNSKMSNVKLTSPKQFNIQKSILSPKNKIEVNTFNNGKNQIKNNLIFKKSNLQQRGSLVKKQKTQSSTMCVDKNKNMKSCTSQSLVSQTDQQSNNQQNGNLNVDLQTSIWKQSEQEQIQNISNFIQSQSVISQLKENNLKKEKEITNLKKQNQQLHKKLEKIKNNQQQNRKMLKNRINSFNQEGEELKTYKNKISQLEEQIQKLKQNTNNIQRKSFNLQSNLYKIQIQSLNLNNTHHDSSSSQNMKTQQRLSNKQMVDQNMMTCSEDSLSEGILSFLNNQGSHSFSSQSRREESQSFLNLQLDKIKIKYQQKYCQKVQNLRLIYQQNLADIEKRYNLMTEQNKNIIKEQANQLYTLQKQLDSLYQKIQNAGDNLIHKENHAIDILEQNQEKLKYRIEINKYKRKLQEKKQQLKSANQTSQLHQIQCKRIQAELDIERMKANLNLQRNFNKIQILKVEQSQVLELVKEELRRQKQKNTKLQTGCEEKEQIIKKLACLNNKKYVGRK